MKQLHLLLFISFCSSSLFAQLRVGVQGGFNMAKFLPVEERESSLPESHQTDWFRGGQIGIIAEVRISKPIFIRSGLFINGKGTVMNSETTIDTSRKNIELHYLEIPFVAVYKRKISKTSYAYAGAGLYLAKAIRGVEIGKGNSFSGPFFIQNKVIFSNENPNRLLPMVIKPFDLGYTALAGIEHNRIQISLNYSVSSSTILPNTDIYSVNFKHSVLTLSLAYFLLNNQR